MSKNPAELLEDTARTTKLHLYIALSYKLVTKLLLLDKNIPTLIKINNIFFLLLAPLFLMYELLATIIPLPFSEIITLYSFAIIYLSWTVSISLIGLLYYTIIRYHITNNEQHIATIENAIGDPFHTLHDQYYQHRYKPPIKHYIITLTRYLKQNMRILTFYSIQHSRHHH